MVKPRLRLASFDDWALHYGVPAGTLRYWKHLDGWTPYGTERARLWNMTEVQASYDRRRGVSSCA